MSQADAKNFKKQFEQLKVGLKFGLSGAVFELLKYPEAIRRYIYTINVSENFSSTFGVVMPASGWFFSE